MGAGAETPGGRCLSPPCIPVCSAFRDSRGRLPRRPPGAVTAVPWRCPEVSGCSWCCGLCTATLVLAHPVRPGFPPGGAACALVAKKKNERARVEPSDERKQSRTETGWCPTVALNVARFAGVWPHPARDNPRSFVPFWKPNACLCMYRSWLMHVSVSPAKPHVKELNVSNILLHNGSHVYDI